LKALCYHSEEKVESSKEIIATFWLGKGGIGAASGERRAASGEAIEASSWWLATGNFEFSCLFSPNSHRLHGFLTADAQTFCSRFKAFSRRNWELIHEEVTDFGRAGSDAGRGSESGFCDIRFFGKPIGQ
jgi:hypothetical protein